MTIEVEGLTKAYRGTYARRAAARGRCSTGREGGAPVAVGAEPPRLDCGDTPHSALARRRGTRGDGSQRGRQEEGRRVLPGDGSALGDCRGFAGRSGHAHPRRAGQRPHQTGCRRPFGRSMPAKPSSNPGSRSDSSSTMPPVDGRASTGERVRQPTCWTRSARASSTCSDASSPGSRIVRSPTYSTCRRPRSRRTSTASSPSCTSATGSTR